MGHEPIFFSDKYLVIFFKEGLLPRSLMQNEMIEQSEKKGTDADIQQQNILMCRN